MSDVGSGSPLRITPTQADAAYSILCQHAGASDRPGERSAFVRYVTRERTRFDCVEWRFQGVLGFGGKFYAGEGTPCVGCYIDECGSTQAVCGNDFLDKKTRSPCEPRVSLGRKRPPEISANTKGFSDARTLPVGRS